jgi:hypothetical protein
MYEGKCKMENGRCMMGNVKWKMEDERWKYFIFSISEINEMRSNAN